MITVHVTVRTGIGDWAYEVTVCLLCDQKLEEGRDGLVTIYVANLPSGRVVVRTGYHGNGHVVFVT
jgi:hypothetical protein